MDKMSACLFSRIDRGFMDGTFQDYGVGRTHGVLLQPALPFGNSSLPQERYDLVL